jgi:hypothetical protein
VVASRSRDALEEFPLRDVIDRTWEFLRLRHIKTGILKSSMGSGVDKVLNAIGYDYTKRYILTERWVKGDKRAQRG